MKLIPSDALKAHLLEQNVVMPEGGFDIPDGEMEAASASLSESPIHRHESAEDFKYRVDYYVIWKFYGLQQNGNQRGVDLVNAQRMEVMTRSLTKMQDSSLPDVAQKVSAAIEDSKNVVHAAVSELKSVTHLGHQDIVEAVAGLKMFSAESHAEALKVRGDLHDELKELLEDLYLLGRWFLGIVVTGIVALVLIAILNIHAHAQIDVIRFQDNAGSALGTVAAPFALKAGANCTWAHSGAVWTINCAGGGGGTTINVNGVAATTQSPINFQSGTSITVSNPSAGNIAFNFSGQLALSIVSASHKWLNSYDATTGQFTQTQPDYSDLTGTPTLPANTTATANNFFTAYNSTTGAFTKARPACADLSNAGTLCTSSATIPTNFGFLFSHPTGFTTLGSGATNYLGVVGSGGFGSDANTRITMPFACTVRNLYVESSGAQPASGTFTITLYVNGVSQAGGPTIVIPINGAGGIRSDTTNTFAVNAGDKVSWQGVNAATATSTSIQNINAQCN